jgi:hypothetical protein
MAIPTVDQATEASRARPTREKFLWFTVDLNPREYLDYLKTILPVEEPCLAFLNNLLAGNNQIDTRVLYRNFRLIENILLRDLHEARSTVLGKKQNSQTAAKLLNDLTTALASWDQNRFRNDYYEYGSEINRGQYKTAARFIVAQAAPFFTSIHFTKSPDVQAQTIRTALSLITESTEYENHVSAILRGRAMESGAKRDVGEDEFYLALVELIASWNKDERKAITKQLGDMLGIDDEQNSAIHVPVTPNMISLAELILANIRLHNQNDVDFSKAPDNEKAVMLSARGSELGTEPLPAFVKKLKSALEKGRFSENEQLLARQLFETILIEARLFNPAIILAVVETYGHDKLREALIKAYSRRDQTISMEEVDDVLMYIVTGTFASKPNQQTHSLAEQGLQWLRDDLSETKLIDVIASLIRSTAKFGLHSIKGVNPLPQALVIKAGDAVTQQDLDTYFGALNASKEQRAAAGTALHDKNEGRRLGLEECLISNRKKLETETRHSLENRMGRFLEVENTLWETVAATVKNNPTKAGETAVALWSLSFTTCISLLNEPDSAFFQLDPQLVLEFSSILAQRITARYDSITLLRVTPDSGIPQRLKAALCLSINRAAGHWNPVVTKALFAQIQTIVAQNDSHYFSGLIPDIINAVTLEQVSSKVGKPAGYRAGYRTETVELLAALLKSFSGNTLVVGPNARMSLITALSSISGDLTQLAARWNGNKEYQWKEGIDSTAPRQQERETAAVALLLNLLAGHAGGSTKTGAPSEGQTALAIALNESIAMEIAAIFQAEMPSDTLLPNIIASSQKMKNVEHAGEKAIKDMGSVALKQLNELKELAKHKKLTLTTVQDLIKTSLLSFGSTIEGISTLKLKQKKTSDAEEPEVDLYDVLAALAQQYLVGKHDPEIAPIGAVLAQELAQRFKDENIAIAPIADLRAKIALILNETMSEDLTSAVALDAKRTSQTVLAASLVRDFEAAQLFRAVENAELTREDAQLIKEYLEAVRSVRRSVVAHNGEIERQIARIRKNLMSVLGAATHLIKMPAWSEISGFMDEEIEALVAKKAQAAQSS